jgi:hypothetical protein
MCTVPTESDEIYGVDVRGLRLPVGAPIFSIKEHFAIIISKVTNIL